MGMLLLGGVARPLGRAVAALVCESKRPVSFLGAAPEMSGLPPCPTVPWPSENKAAFLDALRGVDAIALVGGLPLAPAYDPGQEAAFLAEAKELERQVREIVAALADRKGKPVTLVVASSLAFYGAPSSTEPVSLDEACGGGVEPWARAVGAVEAALRQLPYGAGRPVSVRLAATPDLLSRAILPRNRDALVPWIAERDAVRLVLHCLTTARLEGAVNGAAPEALSLAALAESLENQGAPAPKTALRPERWPSLRASADKAVRSGFRFEAASTTAALAGMSEGGVEGDSLTFVRWVAAPLETVRARLVAREPRYRVVLGGAFPLQWETRRSPLGDEAGFEEELLRGALQLFRRSVRMKALAGGTQVEERVEYRLRGGSLVERWLGDAVRQRLAAYFEALWNETPEAPSPGVTVPPPLPS